MQSKLLRVLEMRQITRLGSAKQTRIDVRVIAASNRDLVKMIQEGKFREDLYYRLQVLNLHIPPLRERREDIPLLTSFFLKEICHGSQAQHTKLSAEARRKLLHYNWPGNIRELRNVIYRVSVLSEDGVISGDVVENAIQSNGSPLRENQEITAQSRIKTIQTQIHDSYRDLVNEALASTGGNKKEAAQLLGVTRQTIYRMIDKYCK